MGADGAPPMSLVSGEVIEAMCKRASACPPGCLVEVGVYKGGTAWHLSKVAEAQARPFYAYDTFTGIPNKSSIDSHVIGDFSDTTLEAVRAAIGMHACIVPGVFPASAVEMGPVAFVHLDCDQYLSYQEALTYLAPRMVEGGVIWCDDADCLVGAGTAVREFAARSGRHVARDGKWIIQF